MLFDILHQLHFCKSSYDNDLLLYKFLKKLWINLMAVLLQLSIESLEKNMIDLEIRSRIYD